MRRQKFYDIPKEAFLFKQVIGTTDPMPEEPVRQWCAFELIRAYGLFVSDFTFEQPVKVGSKNYRIDILVKRHGSPWIVVECKEREFKGSAIDQAISYADARGIHAEYAIYTNGSDWVVRRKLNDQWLEVLDLPWPEALNDNGHRFLDILRGIDSIGPLIYKLDERMSGVEAECFLTVLQTFFNGHNLLTYIADDRLCNAADNVLRVLSVRDVHVGYRFEKLRHACEDWKRFAELKGLRAMAYEVYPGDELHREFAFLKHELKMLIEQTPASASGDLLLLRLSIALLDYGQHAFREKNQFTELPPHVHQVLREFFNLALQLQLNTQLPDHLDADEMKDVKLYCSQGWESLLKNIRTGTAQ